LLLGGIEVGDVSNEVLTNLVVSYSSRNGVILPLYSVNGDVDGGSDVREVVYQI
jgi:hypothetical protein